MGSVFTRFQSQRWYIRYKDATGAWRQDVTDLYGSEHAAKAHQVLVLVEQKIAAGAEVSSGPVTVEAWAGKWEEQRKTLDIADWKNDCSRYRMHAAPVIGHLLIHEVRPRHLVEIVVRMRAKKKAPRTVRNVYSVLRAIVSSAEQDVVDRLGVGLHIARVAAKHFCHRRAGLAPASPPGVGEARPRRRTRRVRRGVEDEGEPEGVRGGGEARRAACFACANSPMKWL
jgi:hypothetical protein